MPRNTADYKIHEIHKKYFCKVTKQDVVEANMQAWKKFLNNEISVNEVYRSPLHFEVLISILGFLCFWEICGVQRYVSPGKKHQRATLFGDFYKGGSHGN